MTDNDPLARFRCRCKRCNPTGWAAEDEDINGPKPVRRRRRRTRNPYLASWQDMLRAGLHPVTGQPLEDGERVA